MPAPKKYDEDPGTGINRTRRTFSFHRTVKDVDFTWMKRTGLTSNCGSIGSSDLETEVDRLVALGATRVDWVYPDDAEFVVLADTEGNLFCVIN